MIYGMAPWLEAIKNMEWSLGVEFFFGLSLYSCHLVIPSVYI